MLNYKLNFLYSILYLYYLYENLDVSQVSDNVLKHQFNEYVKSRGKDPYNLKKEEEEALKQDMNSDYYPGNYFILDYARELSKH